jgi:hypothetical protein
VFIAQVTKNFPAVFTNDTLLHTMLAYLDNTNYYQRNTVVAAMATLIVHNKLDEAVSRQLVKLLLTRAVDSNAHCRSHLLVQMQNVIEKRNPLITRPVVMEEILEVVVSRISDKSPFVRKASLCLL